MNFTLYIALSQLVAIACAYSDVRRTSVARLYGLGWPAVSMPQSGRRCAVQRPSSSARWIVADMAVFSQKIGIEREEKMSKM